uniref:Reverse transcriptase zinc-binding domain-containing protein n=1 Tax=Myripristis murdjan TaxID=586833 RepID=A0A668APH5_9TELE
MNVFPRLSFLLSSIPLKIPDYWFKEIKSLFTKFLWRNNKPRISLSKLTLSREKGGLGIPDIYDYYLAFNGKYPMSWAYHEHCVVGSWLWLEKNIIYDCKKDISLSSLWYAPKTKTNVKNAIIDFSCEITKIIHKKCAINGLTLPSCPLWQNPLFSAGGKMLSNEIWISHNIKSLDQIIKQGKIISFNKLKTKFALNDTCFLQDTKLKEITRNRGTISKLYKFIHTSPASIMNKIKLQWEQDLGKNLTAQQWSAIMQHPNAASRCIRYKLIQLKLLHRVYITPLKLKKMDPDTSDACWHGCRERGTMMHMLWDCPEVKRLWEGVHNALSKIINVNIYVSPEMCLLGIGMTWPPQSPGLNPIEMVWGELDRRVKAKGPTRAKHLWELLQDCWKTISGDYLLKLIERMPRVCKAVIRAKGGYFEETRT